MAAVATGIIAFGKSSVDALKDVNSQSVTLQKVMGGSIEDASRMRYAASVLGVDTDSLARGMQFLSKNIAGNSKDWQKLGINAKDAHGKIRPMSELLPEIIDKLSKMPNGIEKTALMTKLFGKGWKDLTPILNGGGAQLKGLEAESDALGLTLDKNTQGSIKNTAIEQRKLSEAWKGLKVTIGNELMPVLTSFINYLVVNVIPVVKDVIKWMKEHKSTMHLLVAVLGPLTAASLLLGGVLKIFGPLFRVLGPLIRGVTIAMRALNLAFLANPIVLIIVAIIALVAGFIWLWKNCESFRNFWKAAWRDIQQWAADAGHWIVSAWNAVIGWFKGIPRWFHDVFFSVWRSITGFFGNAADWVAAKFNGLMAWFAALPGRIVSFFAGLGSGIVNAIGNIPILGSIIHAIPGLASGGTVTQGGATWVGERGPELLNLPSGSKVTPMGAGGGTTVNVVVNVAGHFKAEKDLAVAISGHVRNELRRVGARNGGVVGLA
jgi:hypothetical protein